MSVTLGDGQVEAPVRAVRLGSFEQALFDEIVSRIVASEVERNPAYLRHPQTTPSLGRAACEVAAEVIRARREWIAEC